MRANTSGSVSRIRATSSATFPLPITTARAPESSPGWTCSPTTTLPKKRKRGSSAVFSNCLLIDLILG
ncbi:Uncharacterised protein [Mycobacterium tuberculosis]|nr:Uncharacterised protein [Mycobacterium tuberculosis]